MLSKKTETVLAGVYWGNKTYDWRSNDMAATALAFKILEEEQGQSYLLRQIINYFLAERKDGAWRNTVESASTVAAILPYMLHNNSSLQQPAVVTIGASSPIRIDKFPFTTTLSNTSEPISINRSGGGLVYLTAWQEVFNKDPQPVTNKFLVESFFERSGLSIASLKAGEKVTMKVKINAAGDADYVAIEIPIPAGCTYANTNDKGGTIHKEFLKNKLIIFSEKIKKGSTEFEVQLEPRYSGVYHLNPTKAWLMYFPVVYGRNGLKSVKIEN